MDSQTLIATLEAAPGIIIGLIREVAPQNLKRRPMPNKWSAHEHACHLALMEPMWAARAERILTEDNPAIVSYEPDDEDPHRLLAMDRDELIDDYRLHVT